MDYNLAFERALSNNFVATISYVGTLGRHLPISINTNSTTVLLPSGTTQAFLPFPDFTGSSDMLYEGISEYNGLQTKLQKNVFLTAWTSLRITRGPTRSMTQRIRLEAASAATAIQASFPSAKI